MKNPIIKTHKGYKQECDYMTLQWDANGIYEGQWQDDMLDGEGIIFIGINPTDKCFVSNLTQEQMNNAEPQ